jgi:hypothetical protein
MLAEMLKREDVTVEWEPPREQRGMAEIGQRVIVAIVARGTLAAIEVAIAKFRKHMRGRAEVIIEDDEQDEDPED